MTLTPDVDLLAAVDEARTAAVTLTPTAIEVWAPAFSWLPTEAITEAVLTICDDWRLGGLAHCKLCETFVRLAARKAHAATHRRELAAYRRRRVAATKQENTSRLRRVNRLRAETRKVVRA